MEYRPIIGAYTLVVSSGEAQTEKNTRDLTRILATKLT